MDIDPLDHRANVGKRLVELRGKLSAREGNAIYKKNCDELRSEITRLETLMRAHDVAPVSDAPREGER